MPARFPNLLVNGSAGIAVGMATNIPPHNLGEIIDASIALIDDPDLGLDDLMRLVPGPDFPTAGIINGAAGIVAAYQHRPRPRAVRARAAVEADRRHAAARRSSSPSCPYQVNKARLIEKIAELVQGKEDRGHLASCATSPTRTACASSSSSSAARSAEVVLNNLYQADADGERCSASTWSRCVDGRPQLLNLKEMLEAFVRHRREVVTRRTIFELRKARDRAHILEGLDGRARQHRRDDRADQDLGDAAGSARGACWRGPGSRALVRALLARAGADASRPEDLADESRPASTTATGCPRSQAQAILDMRLHRLTGPGAGQDDRRIHASCSKRSAA